MALLKPGVVGTLSGKVGGNIFSRNRGGLYVRNWAKPTGGPTPAQSAARQSLSSLASSWKNLTDDQRTAWNAYAAAVPVVNRIGETIRLSGINYYTRLNALRNLLLMSVIATAPSLSASPSNATPPMVLDTLDVSEASVQIASGGKEIGTGDALVLYLSPGSGAGVSAPSSMKPVIAGSKVGVAMLATPTEFDTGTFLLVAGQQYRYEVRWLQANGSLLTIGQGVLTAQA